MIGSLGGPLTRRKDDSAGVGTDSGDAAAVPAIEVRGLVKQYGSGSDAVRAVDGVSFDVQPGTAVGILGPNGAGKTTTIKAILSLVLPTEGDVRVFGIDVQEEPRRAYRHIGAMLEGARNVYWRLTVRENMQFFSRLAGRSARQRRERHQALIEQFGLTEKADTSVRELSRGQKQKVALICTMTRDAEVLFLDEPTLGLDIESSLELRSELRTIVEEEGATVVLSSHDMDVIQDVCDRVIIMNDGNIVSDDSVENLLEGFSVQTYEIVVEEQIPADIRRRLHSTFDVETVERRSDRSFLRLRTEDGDFHDVAEVLRDGGFTVLQFDTVEPDLEEIFLAITSTGDRARADADATLPQS